MPRKLLSTVSFNFLVFFTTISIAGAQQYDAAPTELSVMTWNVEWLYDDYSGDNRSKVAKENTAPSRAQYRTRIEGIANVIGQESPHIVALQEIEGDQTLRDLQQQIRESHGTSYRYAFVQGTDSYLEQDVGILMRNGLVSYGRREQSKTMYDSDDYYNISKHLIAEFRWNNVDRPLTLLTVHFRARKEAEDKRVKQAKLARIFIEEPLNEGHDVIVLGDFNSEHPAGSIQGDIQAIAGPRGGKQMIDLLQSLPNPGQPTHLIIDKQFDRVMVSESLIEDSPGNDWSFLGIRVLDKAVIRGRKDGEEHWDNRLKKDTGEQDLSDHHPVIANFRLK